MHTNTYPSTYEIKDNNVRIDFEGDAARDITYTFTVEKDKLTLVSIEKKQNKNYGLTKQK